MIFRFLVAEGFGPSLHVWKYGMTALKGCNKAGDQGHVLRASLLPRIGR